MDNKEHMVESDHEGEYWDGEEVGDCEEIYMSQDVIIPNVNINIQSSNNLPAIQTYYDDEESALNNFSLSDHQGENAANRSSNSRHPLGLSLGCIPSLLNLLRMCVSNIKDKKFPAEKFPVDSINIGNWQMSSVREGDITAKIYFRKHILVWEILEGGSKYKIEIKWSNISAIRALTTHNGTLEVELHGPPLFFKEVGPIPKKHTNWAKTLDFTGGEASVWRKHVVSCKPEILGQHYEMLLRYDRGLFDLSQKPFPIRNHMFNLGQDLSNTRIFP